MQIRSVFAQVLCVLLVGSLASVAQASSSTSTHSKKHPTKHASTAKRPAAKAVAKPHKVSHVVRRRAEADFDREGNPLIRSSAFVVQDLNSGQILLEKNASQQVPIASISKLMTAMVVLDAQLDLKEVLEVTDEDVDHIKNTSSHLPVGTRLAREELLRLALMASENRAASALSRYYPGGHAAFIAAMNRKSTVLGLHETQFHDSTGLDKNNMSSARDLAIMVATAARYPLIREFTTTAEYTVAIRGRERTFHNTNALVKSPDWEISLSKTGYINESGKCLVMQAWFDKKPMAIVLLDSWGRYTRLGDANRIRKWMESVTAQQKITSAEHEVGEAANPASIM